MSPRAISLSTLSEPTYKLVADLALPKDLQVETKTQRWSKVQRNRPEKIYELDQLALESGHEVIRLPPYHCQYNPIELVWAQAKNEVASKNTTKISKFSQKNWEDCVKHAEKLQEEDLKKSHLAEEFVIHVDDDDSDDSDVEF
ncbi:unnamed protein product [Arctia plantaginis]|uniref:Uncharacterized protein n=1 Tax=Arctia plantaginis TaxID=874455 RepID=A0A8S1AS74_ARCPL|nr:unnamed protein product [Arctia plantaginis]